MSTALIVVNRLQHKKRLSQYFQSQTDFIVKFPRTIRQSIDLAETSTPILIIIWLENSWQLGTRLTTLLKQNQATQHIPILLVQPLAAQTKQIADAHLEPHFTNQELREMMRHFTRGY